MRLSLAGPTATCQPGRPLSAVRVQCYRRVPAGLLEEVCAENSFIFFGARPDGGQAGFLNGLEQTSIALKHLFSRPVSNFKPTMLLQAAGIPPRIRGGMRWRSRFSAAKPTP